MKLRTLLLLVISAGLSLTVCIGCSGANSTGAIEVKDVTEIGIAHTGCYGTCPVYSVTFSADGTVRYDGKIYVERKGQHTGTITSEKFKEVARFVLENGFMGLRDDYSSPVTDNATVITTVVAGGKKKVISDYAHAGPKELAEIERRIDALLSEVKWDERSDGAPKHDK